MFTTKRRPVASSEKTHVCDIQGCGKAFYQRCTLLRHQTLKHGRKQNFRRMTQSMYPFSGSRVQPQQPPAVQLPPMEDLAEQMASRPPSGGATHATSTVAASTSACVDHEKRRVSSEEGVGNPGYQSVEVDSWNKERQLGNFSE